MALVYYLAGNDPQTPDPNGDAYATLAAVDARMVRFDGWTKLDQPTRENHIKAVSAMIDDEIFAGVKWETGQPLEFPRSFSGNGVDFYPIGLESQSELNLELQPKTLRRAVVAQLIYELESLPPGADSYSIGDESWSGLRQDIGLCTEVRTMLSNYLRRP